MANYTEKPKNTGEQLTAADWSAASAEIEEQENYDAAQDSTIAGKVSSGTRTSDLAAQDTRDDAQEAAATAAAATAAAAVAAVDLAGIAWVDGPVDFNDLTTAGTYLIAGEFLNGDATTYHQPGNTGAIKLTVTTVTTPVAVVVQEYISVDGATRGGQRRRWDGSWNGWLTMDQTPPEDRPRLADYYRPLQGVTAEITQALAYNLTKNSVDIPYASAANKYRFTNCVPEVFVGGSAYATNDNSDFGQGDANYQSITIEFWSNATDVWVHGYAINRSDVWALCDDQRVQPNWTHANAGSADSDFTWKLTQASALWRKWKICMGAAFVGISVNTGATVVPTTAPKFRMAVVGGSFVSGGVNIANVIPPSTTGRIFAGTMWEEFEQLTGIEVWKLGVIGTGYLNPGAFTSGNAGRYGSARRIAALDALPGMDVIVIAGCGNDGNVSYAAADVVTAAQATWTAYKGAHPDAKIVVLGPEPTGWTDTYFDAINVLLKPAAEAHADVDAYIDWRADGFMTGTGKDGTPAGNGNSDAFIAADGLHPTHAGNRYWGEQIRRLLGTIET